MNERLEKWFAKKEAKKKQRELEEKKDVLRAAGLCDREYGKEESEEYPLYDEAKYQYYRETFVEVTDEEYERIKQIVVEEKKEGGEEGRPKVSMILKILSLIGLVSGIIVAFSVVEDSFQAFLSTLVSSIGSCASVWAFSVIIDLLYDIKCK